MYDAVLLVLLALVCLGGVILAALQLPGAWLILAAACAYDWQHGWSVAGAAWLVGLAVLAIVAELLDLVASIVAAQKGGASRRASLGSLAGGLAGMLLLSIPVPLVGTIIGGLVGCFLGAFLAEWTVRDELKASLRVGSLATIGRLLGLMARTAAALVMAGVTIVLALRAAWAS